MVPLRISLLFCAALMVACASPQAARAQIQSDSACTNLDKYSSQPTDSSVNSGQLTVDSYSSGHSGAWTLGECIDYALEHNLQIRKNNANVEGSKIDVLEAEAQRGVSVSGSVSQQVQYHPFLESQSTIVNGSTTSSSSNKFIESGTYGINAGWTLWDGGQKRLAVENAKLAQTVAEIQNGLTGNSLQEQIALLYVQTLYTQEALSVNSLQLTVDSFLYFRACEMVKAGVLARAEAAELRAQWSQGKYDIVATGAQIEQYKFKLKQLLELSPGEDFELAHTEISDAQALRLIPTKQDVYDAAVLARPEVRASELAIQQSQMATRIAKLGKLPTVDLSGSLGDSHVTGSGRNFFDQMKQNLAAVVGVSVSIPILDNRKTKSAIERAKVNELTARLDLLDTQKEIWNSIETYWTQATTNQAKFRAAKDNVAAAEESFEMRQAQFKAGLKNIAELQQTRSTLIQAKQDMLVDKYTAAYNIAMLYFYKGQSLDL